MGNPYRRPGRPFGGDLLSTPVIPAVLELLTPGKSYDLPLLGVDFKDFPDIREAMKNMAPFVLGDIHEFVRDQSLTGGYYRNAQGDALKVKP